MITSWFEVPQAIWKSNLFLVWNMAPVYFIGLIMNFVFVVPSQFLGYWSLESNWSLPCRHTYLRIPTFKGSWSHFLRCCFPEKMRSEIFSIFIFNINRKCSINDLKCFFKCLKLTCARLFDVFPYKLLHNRTGAEPVPKFFGIYLRIHIYLCFSH